MVFNGVKTKFLDSKQSRKLVRYDVITQRNGDYKVKVTDIQGHGVAQPHILIEIDEFDILQSSHQQKFGNNGMQTTVRTENPPNFDQYVDQVLQSHRDKLP